MVLGFDSVDIGRLVLLFNSLTENVNVAVAMTISIVMRVAVGNSGIVGDGPGVPEEVIAREYGAMPGWGNYDLKWTSIKTTA